MINEVFDFNHRCLGVEPKEVPHMEHKHAMFNVKAFREEAGELEREHMISHDDGLVETFAAVVYADPRSEEARWQTVKSIDACIDNAYFAIGGLARAGLTPDQAMACFLAVHEANMTKKLGIVASRGDMGVPDAAKPADFVPPERKIYAIIYGQEPPTDVEAKEVVSAK